MNKLKDMITGHHTDKATGTSTSGTHSGNTDGLDIAQREGQNAYNTGNPVSSGRPLKWSASCFLKFHC